MDLPEKHERRLSASAAVKSRFGGISDMSLWRWLHDDKLAFPKPIRIQGRRYWYDHELDAFEEHRKEKSRDTTLEAA